MTAALGFELEDADEDCSPSAPMAQFEVVI
jgi:hypothetical protein